MLASSSGLAPTTPYIHLSLTCLVWFREENTTLISVGTFPSGTPVVHLSPKPKCPIAQTVSMTKESISANSDQSHWKNKCTVHHPKTNMDPLIMMVSNRNLPWKVTFRCHVSFPGCTICQINYFFQKSALMKVSNYEFLQCQCCKNMREICRAEAVSWANSLFFHLAPIGNDIQSHLGRNFTSAENGCRGRSW